MTFVLPTDRGFKVPMTVTLMLTVYTQQKSVSTMLPAATPVPYICQIYLIGLYLSAVSLITAVFTVLMRVLAPALPPSVQRFFINKLGRLCCAPKIRISPETGLHNSDEFMFTKRNAPCETDGEMTCFLRSHFGKLHSQLDELVDLKKNKIARGHQASVNESTWQKIEFLFNAFMLFSYLIVMICLFSIYSIGAQTNIL